MIDPSGLWGGVDDVVFGGGGGVAAVIGQGISDLVTGNEFHWGNYASSFAGGVAAGETLLYTGNPYAAGAVQGAVTNASRQGLKMLTGKQECFNYNSFLTDTAIGTALGALPGNKIRGITTGKGNYNSIYKQMATKGLLGHINNPRTAGKMFAGKFIDAGGLNGIVVGGFINTQTNPLP